MKRQREFTDYQNRPFKKPRASYQTTTMGVKTKSLVPLARRGYRLNPIEKKVVDTQMYGDVSTTGAFFPLCVPVPGAGMNQRIGRKLTIKSVQMKGIVQLELAATPTGAVTAEANHLRMILLYDKQPNGALPALADVLTGGQTVNDLFNIDNRDRFTILKDKVWSFDPMIYDSTNNAYAWNRTCAYCKLYKKLNLETVFNAGTAGTSADINSGNLVVLWLANTPAGVDKNVDIYVNARVRYLDQ